MAEAAVTSISVLPSRPSLDTTRWIGTTPFLAATTLTTSYVATDYVRCGSSQYVTLEFTYVHASAASVEYYVEWSDDGTTFFRSINVATSTGTNTLTMNNQTVATSGNLKWADSFLTQCPFFRINYKSTTNGDGTLACKAVLLGQ